MRYTAFFALLFCTLLFAGCPSENPEPSNIPTITHKLPAKGSEYDISWTRFERNGQQSSTVRTDTVTVVLAHDTVFAGRSGVTVFAATKRESPGQVHRLTALRVNSNNDLEITSSEDEMSLNRWVTLPVQTRSQKILNLDTMLYYPGDTLRLSGTITSTYAGDTTVTIDGTSIQVAKLRQTGDMETYRGSTLAAYADISRTFWYAPSIGYFVYVEDTQDGQGLGSSDMFRLIRQYLQRYRLN